MHGLWRWHSATLLLSRHRITKEVRTQMLRVGLGMCGSRVLCLWDLSDCVRVWWGIVGHYGTSVCMGWCCQEFALHFNLSWSSKRCWSREWRSCSFQELRSLSMNSVSGGGCWRVGSVLVKMSEDLNSWVSNLCYYDLYDTEILKLSNILFLHLICILLESWSLFRLLMSLFQVSWWQTLFFQLLRLTPWHLYWLLFSCNSYLFIRDPAVCLLLTTAVLSPWW